MEGILKNNDKSASKGAVYYLLCQVFLRALSFFSVPIFARLLSKGEYGTFSNFTAWAGLLYTIITLNLRDTINKAKYSFPENQSSYLFSILFTANISTVFFYIIVEMNLIYFEEILSMDAMYIRILFIYLIFYTVYDYVKLTLNINREYIRYTIYLIAIEAATVILSLFLVQFSSDKLIGRTWGYIIPTIVINIVIYVYIILKGRHIRIEYIKFAMIMAIPLIPSSLSNTVLVASDRAMITNMWDSEQTALYQMGYSVASIASMVWYALNQAFGPWLYDNLIKNNYKYIKRKTNIYIIIYSGLIIGVMLVSPEVLTIMGGEKYSSAIAVIPPVMLGMVFQFFYAFYYDIEYYYEKVKLISLGTILSALLNFVLNLVFIPKWGYVAAAYTTLIGYAALFLFHFFICKIVIKKEAIFSTKIVFSSLLLLIVVQLVISFFYDNMLVRGILFLLYCGIGCIVIYKNKELIKLVIGKYIKRKA